jgi:hypothetical protein
MKVSRLLRVFLVLGGAALASQTGCGSGENGGPPGEVGTYDPDAGFSINGADASGPAALDASIEQRGLQVKFITLSCAGDCAMVQAVGTGGHPPYTFAWEDGSTNANRQVCPTASTSYAVKVTDTGMAGEFARAAASARASLTADVLSCPDGGPPQDGGSGSACISNPSFEGTAALDVGPGVFAAPPWSTCGALGGADVWDDTVGAGLGLSGIKASQGGTYVRMISATPEIVSESTCAPLYAGKAYSMTIDLAYEAEGTSSPGYLELWGASAQCDEDQLLWTSPVVGASWNTYCLTFRPTADLAALTLKPRVDSDAASASSTVYADNIVPVAACP